jgi:uncharacterized membrane protein YgcG
VSQGRTSPWKPLARHRVLRSVTCTLAPSRIAGTLAAGLFAFILAAPAFARDAFVIDGAGLFGSTAVAEVNREVADFNRQTGKEVVVVTVPSLNGQTLNQAAEDTFSKEQVNGVLFYFAKAEKQDIVLGDTASRAFFPSGTFGNIHDAMRGYLRSGDFDQALATGVNLVLDQYRSHEGTASVTQPVTRTRTIAPTSRGSSLGGGMSLIWLAIFLFAGFLIIRGIFRALAGPRMMPPGYGGPGPAPGPGYGYGGGYPGGGSGFFSGLLGGLGGAWLGNELFGRQWGGGDTINQGQTAGLGGAGGAGDASGWQADPGQADIGNAGGGGWGDSGGGFDPGSGDGGGGFGDGGGDGGGGW